MSASLERVEITDATDVATSRAGDFPRLAEAAGLDGVGMSDHQHSGRDVYVQLAIAASQTSRIGLFPCVTNPLTRHPMVLASLANSLEELAPGRVRLVLGAGAQSAAHIGRAPASVAELGGAVTMTRELLAGRTVVIGTSATESIVNRTPRPVPVHINASSPRMIRLAGEIADGALLMVGRHPDVVDAAREELAAGAALAGRSTGDMDVAYCLPTFIYPTRERAAQAASGVLKAWLSRPNRMFTRVASAGRHRLGMDESSLLDAMGLVGTPDQCADGLQAFAERTGVRHVVCQFYRAADNDPRYLLNAFERTILPRVK